MTRRVLAFALALLLVAGTAATSAADPDPGGSVAGTAPPVPHFAHIVVVVEENRAYADIVGNPAAPYLNRLARTGALLTNSYAVTHPSQPNYLALFSGSTQGLTDDSCPHTYDARNLASQLRMHGETFVGYAQSLPGAGYPGCRYREYVRKHAPWTNFANLPADSGRPMSRFPAEFDRLPKLAFVVPDLVHDMHDGTVAHADTWLRRHLGAYARWARTHDSLLIVTWDEDDRFAANHIPGMLVGAHVQRTSYAGRVDHYRLLRTIEAACGLPALGAARRRTPITAVWGP